MESQASDVWAPLRRGGGGGGDPVARPIGIMMLMLLPLAALAHATGQNQMCAAMLVGIIFGSSNLDTSVEDVVCCPLSREVNVSFIELGNAFVMFFTGLADAEYGIVSSVGARTVLRMGTTQTAVLTGIFAALGYGVGICTSVVSTVFFGFACCLSSKKVILNYLEETGSTRSIHGRLLQGLSFLQDVFVLVALIIINALKRSIVLPEHYGSSSSVLNGSSGVLNGSRAGSSMAGVAGNGTTPAQINFHQLPDAVTHPLGVASFEVVRAFGIYSIIMIAIRYLNKFHILERAFDFFAGDPEMLFIGTISYGFGVYAICYQVGVCPMSGAYLAGLSLSVLPYQVQIEHKIASLRTFGMTLFYFMLGIYVKLDIYFFRQYFSYGVLVTMVQVIGTPLLTWFLGWRAGLKSRTTVYTSLLSNSMGESTLTLQVMAFQAGVFNRPVFMVLVSATLGSLLLSCATHPFLESFYLRVRPMLAFMDKSSPEELNREEKMPLEEHVVILGFDETGAATAEFFRMAYRDVYMVECDLPLHVTLKQGYKGTMPRAMPRITSRTGMFGAEYLGANTALNEHGDALAPPSRPVRIRLPSLAGTMGKGSFIVASPHKLGLLPQNARPQGSFVCKPVGELRDRHVGKSPQPAPSAQEPWRPQRVSRDLPSPHGRSEAEQAQSDLSEAKLEDVFAAIADFSREDSQSEDARRRSKSWPGGDRPEVKTSTSGAAESAANDVAMPVNATLQSAPPAGQEGSVEVHGSSFGSIHADGTSDDERVQGQDAMVSGGEQDEGRSMVEVGGAGGAREGGLWGSGDGGESGCSGAVVTTSGALSAGAERDGKNTASEVVEDTAPRIPRNRSECSLSEADEAGQGREGMPRNTSDGSLSNKRGIKFSLDTKPASDTKQPRSGRPSLEGRRSFEPHASELSRQSIDRRQSLDHRRTSTEYQYAGARLRRPSADVLTTQHLESNFHVDGHLFGGLTNIISLYADPELEETWERYNIKNAALVISCMNNRFSSNIKLCKYMAGTNIPVVVVCDSNEQAEALYAAGCTYAQQPTLTAANDLKEILREELEVTKDVFTNRALDHLDALDEELSDVLRAQVGKFL